MANTSNRYIIQNHTHSQSAILSVCETQDILQNYNYLRFRSEGSSKTPYLNPKFIRFSDPGESSETGFVDIDSVDFKEFNGFINGSGGLIATSELADKFSFITSNNLYEDISFMEAQILMEKYKRIVGDYYILNQRASTTNFGLVKLADENSGLTIDSSGSMLVDKNGVQSTLVSGTNIKYLNDTDANTTRTQVDLLITDPEKTEVQFKTINNESIIYRANTGESKNFDLVTKTELEQFKSEINGLSSRESSTDITERVDTIQENLATFGNVIINLQKQVMNILTNIQSDTQNSSSSDCEDCNDIKIVKNKSHYIKNVNKTMDSCSTSTKSWFEFDTSSLTQEDTKSALKFILELRVNIDDQSLKSEKMWRFPWTWCKQLPNPTQIGYIGKPDGINFLKDSISIIEITAIWRNECWNYFGKVVDQYIIPIED